MVQGNESQCSGCEACAEVCPVNCISFSTNINGFRVPVINQEICVHCNKCSRECPMNIKSNIEKHIPMAVYGAYAKKEQKRSASGAVSFILGSQIIENGGAVYGSEFTKNLQVVVRRAVTVEDLFRQQGSKYVQSTMDTVIEQINKDIRNGQKVLFTGTPCQVAGVKTALKKLKNGNLYTVEIICHGTPSPKMFADYLRWAEKHYGKKIVSYTFRAKEKDIEKDFMIHLGFSDGSKCSVSGFKDPYYKLFMTSKWFRESCYNCPFANKNRVADITLGDFWNSERLPSSFGKNRRISVVIINSDKGQRLFNAVKDKIIVTDSDWETAIAGNANLERFTKRTDDVHLYGAVKNPMEFFENVSQEKIDIKKYVFNQMPIQMRRKLKGIFNS